MHIADVDQRMLGANGIGTLAMAMGQIAAVSTGYAPSGDGISPQSTSVHGTIRRRGL